MKTEIYFQPATQVDNAGDQLINLATINAIRRYGDIIVDDRSGNTPRWFLEGIGTGNDTTFTSLSDDRFYLGLIKRLFRQRLKREPVRSFLVIPPGHYARKGRDQAKSALIWYAKLRVVRWLGCKPVRAGFSIGPFDEINTRVEAFGSGSYGFYGVRDRKSLALGQRNGFANLHYFPDLAWSYRPTALPKPDAEEGYVVLSFRSNAYGVTHSSEYLAPIRERLRALLRCGDLASRKIVIAHQVLFDRPASIELAEALKDEFNVELIDPKLSIDEASQLYAKAHCVISNRLHVLLLASQSGTFAIPLASGSDNVKITSILDDNGLADVVLDVAAPEAESVARMEDLQRRRGEFLERFARASEENTQKIHGLYAGIFA